MMLQYVYNKHEAVAEFVAQFIPHVRERGFGRCTAIGVLDEKGMLIAGIVYHSWQPEAGIIQISAGALPKARWLTRETIWRMYEYPFLQLDCQMVVQNTPADDERLLYQLARGGYKFTEYPRQFGRDRDGVICRFTREAWEASRIIQRSKPRDTIPAIAIKEAA
jgi:hypothetical protein